MGRPRVLKDKNCVGCGELFRPRDSDKKFCSLHCVYLYRPRNGTWKMCDCSRPFYVVPRDLRENNYCSRRCANLALYKSDLMECKQCRRLYHRPLSQIELRGSSFCSYKCRGLWMSENQQNEANPQWKGGISDPLRRLRASKRFADWRKIVFERDDYTCQACGIRGKYLHPHHMMSFSEFSQWRFSTFNGITLCVECHNQVHHGTL